MNNLLAIDRWQPSSEPYTRSAPVELKAGEKASIRVEHYSADGKGAIHMLWSSASTRKQIIPQRYLYPEAATEKPTPTDTNKQTGMLLPPGSGSGPKAIQSQLGVAIRWLASRLSRAGLALLIAFGVLVLLLRINWRQSLRNVARGCAARCASAALPFRRLWDLLSGYAPMLRLYEKLSELNPLALLPGPGTRGHSPGTKAPLPEGHSRFPTSGGRAAGELRFKARSALSRRQAQIAARLEKLSRIAAAVSDKLQFVVGFSKRLLAGTWDKLNLAGFGKRLLERTRDKLNVASFGKTLFAGASDNLQFVGRFLAAPTFKFVSRVGAAMRYGMQKLAGLLPERVRIVAGRALSRWRGSGLARLRPALRRALVIVLIVRLATPLTPAEAEGLARAAQATWRVMSASTLATSNRYGASSGGELINRSIEMALGGRAGKVFSAASQTGQVEELQVCPRQLVMFVGERYTLTPVALDATQKVVHGVGMSWNSLNAAVAKVSSFGQVEAASVGNTTVEVQCGGVSEQITIEVRSGTRPTGSNQEADIDTSDCAAEQASMFAPQAAAPAPQSLIGDDGVMLDWDPLPLLNSRAAHFRNAVGNPRCTARSQSNAAVPTSTQLGSYSYQFYVPVVSVGGRGASASIGMTLNSRVWNNDNGKMTFDYVGAYPAPGWTMGYGKIIRNYNDTGAGDKSGIGSGNSPGDYLLVAGDGTRIRLAAKYDAQAGCWFHESDDGSFLRFDPKSGEMRYPDGSRMIYSSVNGVLLPTAMINTNGGAITMTYRDYCEGSCHRVFRHRTALSAVRDTRGIYVTFHYYGDNDYPVDVANGHPAGELAAIKAPDMSGAQQEVIRVEYQPITLQYDFGGLAVDAPANGSQIQVVKRIWYPQTGRRFRFLD